MSETSLSPKDHRDLRTLGRVALWSSVAGAAMVASMAMMPTTNRVDPATTPKILAEVEACVAAKPEIEAAARGRRVAIDWTNVLERRLEAVNARDPSQCGEMLRGIRESRKKLEDIAMMSAATS